MLFLNWLTRWLAAYLSKEIVDYRVNITDYEALKDTLRPGDVLLVEGNTRISIAIKYLTQSTWSHAAFYLGPDVVATTSISGEPDTLIEADLEQGIRTLPLSFYRHAHTRICRPRGLTQEHLNQILALAVTRIGHQYDLRNVFDLARYLLPTPPVPTRYRRRMLAFGSGDPTRAICSTFIAELFQSVHYPILPQMRTIPSDDPNCANCVRELYRIRHHSLFVPRDFDASPYFDIIKPTLARGFDYTSMTWE